MNLIEAEIVTRAGIYQMPAAAYHADPCPTPSLWSTGARLILDRSPLHAAMACPKIGKREQRPPSKAMMMGSLAHAVVLGQGDEYVVSPYEDFRSKDARAWRDAQPANVMIVDQDMLDNAKAMARVLSHDMLDLLEGSIESEVVFAWDERCAYLGDHTRRWNRAMVDAINNDGSVIVDYKTTSGSASPEAAARQLYANGYHIQEAWYRRAVAACVGHDPLRRFYFLFQEQHPPHAFCILETDPAAREFADRQIDVALVLWHQGLEKNFWRGYPTTPRVAPMPHWLMRDSIDQDMMREDNGEDV